MKNIEKKGRKSNAKKRVELSKPLIDHFAPFSHDAELASGPEPGTLILMGSGLAGLFVFRKKIHKNI